MSQRLFTPVYLDVRKLDNEGLELEKRGREKDSASMSVRPVDDFEGKTLNPNTYATRKTIAQGMLDIALLTANASQLRYILVQGKDREDYGLMIGLIVTSLVLQVLVGILILIIGALNINKLEYQKSANILNNIIATMMFIITVVNVVLNSFGLTYVQSSDRRSP